MLVKRLTYPMILLAMAISAQAQDSLLLRDYQFVRQQEAWLACDNAAGLTHYNSQNIAAADVSLTCGRGGLTNYYESPKVIQMDAAIESFYRISNRTVVFGRMRYDNYTGHDMTGSAFLTSHLSPLTSHLYPFDIVEDSLTNQGRKHRDTYQLTGAVGVDLWRGISLGVRADYTAANYAKYKDLRHKNKLMDLTTTVGILIPVGHVGSIGANYRYHRNIESVTFGTYGKSDKVYKSLIDYGNFVGKVEQFGSYGYTDKSREMPLFDEGHGVGVQVEVKPIESLSFHNEFIYSHRSGYYGRKSPYTITYTNHHGNSYTYNGQLTFRNDQTLHRLDICLEAEKLQNNAETYRELQNDAGSNYYEYYDDVKTADKLWVNTTIGYTAHFGIRQELPTWTLHAAVGMLHRKQTAYFYPYLRRQELYNKSITLQATRNLCLSHGVLSLSASLGYLKGSGDPYEDDTFINPSDKQNPPDEMSACLWREYQYLTAARYEVGGSVKYAFIFPGTRMKTHISLAASHRKANQTYEYSNGKDYTQMAVSLGCTF